MKEAYCANCGKRLAVMRKAMPKFGRIIDLVEWHECSEEPQEIDLTPIGVPVFDQKGDKTKFVEKLDRMQGTIGTDMLRDRRKAEYVKEETTSTAPTSLINEVIGKKPVVGEDPRDIGVEGMEPEDV